MKKISPIFGITLLGVLLLSACAAQPAPAASAPETIDQQPDTLIVEGQLVPANSMAQFFSRPGRVAEVLVQDGELVTAGQALARLEDSPEAQAARARAEQEVLAAQQALDSLQAGAAASLARARLDQIAAEKALEEAQADFDADASDENQALLDQAQAVLDRARDLYETLAGSGGVDPDQLAAANARLVSARAALESAQAALDSLELKANMAGTVVDLNLKAGHWVNAGAAVITIADFSGWLVETGNLTETDVVKIKTGQAVRVTLDALPAQTISGEVTHINARFEEKRGEITYTATIALNQTDPLQRWGMTAAVQFQP